MWGISFGLVRERCVVFEKRLAFRGIMYFWKWLQKEFETGNILAEMKLRRPTISSGIRTKAVVIYLMELDSGNGGTVCKIHSLFTAKVGEPNFFSFSSAGVRVVPISQISVNFG